MNRLIEDYRSESTNIETLEYALEAWNKAIFSPYAPMDEKGWILGPNDELLFWVPARMRMHLWRPCMSHSVNAVEGKSVKLKFDKFIHGTSWAKCKI